MLVTIVSRLGIRLKDPLSWKLWPFEGCDALVSLGLKWFRWLALGMSVAGTLIKNQSIKCSSVRQEI